MSTTDVSLARVLKALLSTGDVTLSHSPSGYTLTVASVVMLDSPHALAVRDACQIAIIDHEEVTTRTT